MEDVLTVEAQLKAYEGTPHGKTLYRAKKKERMLIPLAKESEQRLRMLRKKLKAARTSENKKSEEKILDLMDKEYSKFNKAFNRRK